MVSFVNLLENEFNLAHKLIPKENIFMIYRTSKNIRKILDKIQLNAIIHVKKKITFPDDKELENKLIFLNKRYKVTELYFDECQLYKVFNIKNIIKKMLEDFRALQSTNVGGVKTIVLKNINKLNQFNF
jgi:hypothetical protein